MKLLRVFFTVVCLAVLLGCGLLPVPVKEIKHLQVVETVVAVSPTATPGAPFVPHVLESTPTPDMFLCELNNQHPYQLLVEKFDYTLDGDTGMGVRIVGAIAFEPVTDTVTDAARLYVSCENAIIMDLITNGDEGSGGVIDLLLVHMAQCGRMQVLNTSPAELKLFFVGCDAATYEFPDIDFDIHPAPNWGDGEYDS